MEVYQGDYLSTTKEGAIFNLAWVHDLVWANEGQEHKVRITRKGVGSCEYPVSLELRALRNGSMEARWKADTVGQGFLDCAMFKRVGGYDAVYRFTWKLIAPVVIEYYVWSSPPKALAAEYFSDRNDEGGNDGSHSSRRHSE